MNILDQIIAYKKTEVAQRKIGMPVEHLQATAFYARETFSLKDFLLDDSKTGIIAEFKRQSPSKGIINGSADVTAVTTAYTAAGASCLSVLTDSHFFGGSTDDLIKARVNQVPILRKDFIIDEYQISEAKSMGADVILLIAACLTPARVQELARFATSLGLSTLLELHAQEELGHICDETVFIGINNRNLKSFEVDIARSLSMAKQLPAGKIKIAESGISTVAAIQQFRSHGFAGFLIGENFMKQADPGEAFTRFATELKLPSGQV